jgi:hypothetical protein
LKLIKVAFWTIQHQILLISNPFWSVFSPRICCETHRIAWASSSFSYTVVSLHIIRTLLGSCEWRYNSYLSISDIFGGKLKIVN